MQLVTLGFDASYDVERLDRTPPSKMYEFARPRQTAGELVLETGFVTLHFEVAPLGRRPWIGAFECGPGGLTGLFATPSPDVLCVVAQGQGFWVPVLEPERFEITRSFPVKRVISVPGEPILVLVDYTRFPRSRSPPWPPIPGEGACSATESPSIHRPPAWPALSACTRGVRASAGQPGAAFSTERTNPTSRNVAHSAATGVGRRAERVPRISVPTVRYTPHPTAATRHASVPGRSAPARRSLRYVRVVQTR